MQLPLFLNYATILESLKICSRINCIEYEKEQRATARHFLEFITKS